jgi:hypothetical protein
MADYMERYQNMLNKVLKSDDIVAYHGIVAGPDDVQKNEFLKKLSKACDRLKEQTSIVHPPVKLPDHLPPLNPDAITDDLDHPAFPPIKTKE